MFEIDSISFQEPWHLSHPEEQEVVDIKEDERKNLNNFDLLAINFLYQNYKKNYKGAILNEQKGFDMQLQVATFLNVMFRCIEQKFLTLVIAPEYLMAKWCQYLTQFTNLKALVVNSETCPQDFDDQHGVVLIISFNDLKLLEPLVDYNFFSVVIDCFDEVARKTSIKKLSGDFHIGLTNRNFYFQPDQRLQWMMLDWCSPDCCGKSKSFCKVDNDNFANFRNNYRHWWFRLSRYFCDSLKDVIEQEEAIEFTNVKMVSLAKNRKKPTKKSQVKKCPKKRNKSVHLMKTEQVPTKNNEDRKDDDMSTANNKEALQLKASSPLINDDDDDPINLLLPSSKDQGHEIEHVYHDGYKMECETIIPHDVTTEVKNENFSNTSEDILLSLIGGDDQSKPYVSNPEDELLLKKEELSSQIFSDQEINSKLSEEKENSGDILLSFID